MRAPSEPGSREATGLAARLAAAVRAANARLSWRITTITVLIALALTLWSVFDFAVNDEPFTWVTVAAAIVTTTAVAFSVMFMTLIADELVGEAPGRFLGYALAVVAGSAIGAISQWLLLDWLHLSWSLHRPGINPRMLAMQPAFVFFEYLIWGSVIVAIHVNRLAASRAAQRLAVARQSAAATQRRTLEARLQALQARVDPRFLFGGLARVRDGYDRDLEQGSRMLDDLIAHLRATLPRTREPVSAPEIPHGSTARSHR